METIDLITVSGNDTDAGQLPPPLFLEEEENPDYTERFDLALEYMFQLNEKLDRLIELQEQTLSGNELPDEEAEKEINVYVTVSQNAVSENSISSNTVSENALVTTPLEEYSVGESLLLILVFLVLFDIIIRFFFRNGGKE